MPRRPHSPRSPGFTLIELVMAIVILGTLAAAGLPRFVDLSTEADLARAQAVGAAISAGSAINLAARRSGSPGAVVVNQANPCSVAILGQLTQGSLPAAYSYTQPEGGCSTGAATALCSITPVGSRFPIAQASISCAP
jgi:MSHA pilin protein MshA